MHKHFIILRSYFISLVYSILNSLIGECCHSDSNWAKLSCNYSYQLCSTLINSNLIM